MEMALGTVGQLEQVISQALARPVEAAQAYVRGQEAKNVEAKTNGETKLGSAGYAPA